MKTFRKAKASPTSAPRHSEAAPLFAPRLVKSLGRALLIALIVGLAFSLIAAAFAYSSPDPEALIGPLALCIPVLLSLLGGFLSYRGCKQKCLICGATFGLLLVLLLWLFGWLIPGSGSAPWSSAIRWGLRFGVIFFSVLGSLLASYAPRKRSRKRRK